MTVFVGPSIWRAIDVRTATSAFVAMSNAPQEERVIWAPLWNDALIGRSRSIMCTEFLKSDADVMVIIDDDIVFNSPDFWKIVEGCRDTRGIYGGAYVTRSQNPYLTSRAFPNMNMSFYHSPQRRPVEFQYLATGFFAIHRDVLEAMIDAEIPTADGREKIAECQLGADRPFYPFFSPIQIVEEDGRRHYLSEDWAVCYRARHLGFRVWVDQSIILQHMGLYPYTVADIHGATTTLPSTGIDRATFDSEPMKTGEPLIDNLVADIAEWAGEDIGDVRRMVAQGMEDTHRLFLEKPLGQSEEEWYQREDVGMAYICDLALWHLRGGGARPLVEQSGRVLDYGAGIGTYALLAARNGADVTCYEPNPTMREFMAWRAERYGIPLTIGEPDGAYDAISCWHVFEHVQKPEALLDHLLSMLKPDGVLVSDSGFDDQHTPQHHSHPDWDAVLKSRGLYATKQSVYRRIEQPVLEVMAG